MALVPADRPPARGVVGEPTIRLRLGGPLPLHLPPVGKSRKQRAESRKQASKDSDQGTENRGQRAVVNSQWSRRPVVSRILRSSLLANAADPGS